MYIANGEDIPSLEEARGIVKALDDVKGLIGTKAVTLSNTQQKSENIVGVSEEKDKRFARNLLINNSSLEKKKKSFDESLEKSTPHSEEIVSKGKEIVDVLNVITGQNVQVLSNDEAEERLIDVEENNVVVDLSNISSDNFADGKNGRTFAAEISNLDNINVQTSIYVMPENMKSGNEVEAAYVDGVVKALTSVSNIGLLGKRV